MFAKDRGPSRVTVFFRNAPVDVLFGVTVVGVIAAVVNLPAASTPSAALVCLELVMYGALASALVSMRALMRRRTRRVDLPIPIAAMALVIFVLSLLRTAGMGPVPWVGNLALLVASATIVVEVASQSRRESRRRVFVQGDVDDA